MALQIVTVKEVASMFCFFLFVLFVFFYCFFLISIQTSYETKSVQLKSTEWTSSKVQSPIKGHQQHVHSIQKLIIYIHIYIYIYIYIYLYLYLHDTASVYINKLTRQWYCSLLLWSLCRSNLYPSKPFQRWFGVLIRLVKRMQTFGE